MSKKPILLPIILLLLAMFSIQGGASLAKNIFPLIGPEGTTALRLAFGSAILFMIMRPWRSPLTQDSWRSVLAYGIALGSMNLLFYMSIARIPLGIAVALEFIGPLCLALFRSRGAADVLWIALAAIGLWLLIPKQAENTSLDIVGVMLALAAGVSWAFYIVFGQQAGFKHGPYAVAWGSLIAASFVFPIGLVINGNALLNPNLLPIAFAVAVLSSALPYSLEMSALTRLPTKTFSMLVSLEPAIAALTAMIFLREHLTLIQWIAIVAIIISAAGVSLSAVTKDQIPVNTQS